MQGAMVRATNDDLKSQTRRVVKPQPREWRKLGLPEHPEMMREFCTGSPEHGLAYYWHHGPCWNSSPPIKCPHGVPGDRLWVRETWNCLHMMEDDYFLDDDDGEPIEELFYRATDDGVGDRYYDSDKDEYVDMKWKPSIFMPRKYSRLTLELTNVRGERIQDITEEDAKAEGCLNDVVLEYDKAGPIDYRGLYAVERFEELWNSINAKPKPVKKWYNLTADPGNIIAYVSYPWDEATRDPRTEINGKPHICYPNPWVWALTFKKL